jgi:hypothetical protein
MKILALIYYFLENLTQDFQERQQINVFGLFFTKMYSVSEIVSYVIIGNTMPILSTIKLQNPQPGFSFYKVMNIFLFSYECWVIMSN